MTAPDCIYVDFETYPIRTRPDYPPKPVGCAFAFPREQPFYMAWGHPTENNCNVSDAQEMFDKIGRAGLPVAFHNAKFDIAVAREKLGRRLFVPLWQDYHDTMFLAYLCDPHARALGLKELAEDLLAWPPEERDALTAWIFEHKAALLQAYPWNRKLNKKTGNPVDNIAPSDTGAWIFATPGKLAGQYACGDIARTRALFEHCWPLVQENGMGAAYDRERQLMPILMENERDGMRVDMERLGIDGERYDTAFELAEDWLRQALHASGLNFDADQDVASVLLERGIVPKENWSLTESGALSMSKESLLPSAFTGPHGAHIASVLGYRNRLKTCLTMFMRPWWAQASQYGGRITTNWNQTRGDRGGTRTGRPSTDKHNFLNISKSWDGKDDGYIHPDFLKVPLLPLVRKYVLPDEESTFLHRDFDGQELRVFAHFEQGDLWAAYHGNPALDPHAKVGEDVQRVLDFTFGPGVRVLDRTKIKTLNFQSIYGGGVPALQAKLRITTAEAKELKQLHDKALPGRKILNEEIKKLVALGIPIRTWGGRLYFCEKPGADGRSKDYKLINYEVQGSAADLTKQSIIDWYAARDRESARFMVTVYDEINISSRIGREAADMRLLKDVMEANRLTVPMRSSPKHGSTWGDAKTCKLPDGTIDPRCLICA